MKRMKSLMLVISMIFLVSCMDMYNDIADDFEYKLRDRGPAGGWIFYINPNYKQDGWKYLEAAPYDQSVWYKYSVPANVLIGLSAQGTAVGTGITNTIAIVTKAGITNSAAKLCYDLVINGYDDWFLPSRDELYWMCWNLRGKKYEGADISNQDVPIPVGNFASNSSYWTSTEVADEWAIYIYFNNGLQTTYYKDDDSNIRAIRAF